METKHTPGPWTTSCGAGLFVSAGPKNIAMVRKHGGDGPGEVLLPDAETAANARLIASAPALYDACEAIEAWAAERGDIYVRPIEAVRAALARARGEAE